LEGRIEAAISQLETLTISLDSEIQTIEEEEDDNEQIDNFLSELESTLKEGDKERANE